MLTLCCTTLRKYDLLVNMVKSALEGELKPNHIVIIDNGKELSTTIYKQQLNDLLSKYRVTCRLLAVEKQISLAESWNYYIDNIPDIRITVNDDILFHKDTLKILVDNYDSTKINCTSNENSFSCFILPDSVVKIVGKFDSAFYPAYFEDVDYMYRADLLGVKRTAAPCNFFHEHSSTIRSYNQHEMNRHHEQFRALQQYYTKKWGGLPEHEIYKTPFNKG